MDLTDQEKEQYGAEFEQVDEKVLQVQILMQLREMNHHLRNIEESFSEPSEPSEPQLKCTVCNDTLPKEEKEQHGENCFSWHNGLSEKVLNSRYERIE